MGLKTLGVPTSAPPRGYRLSPVRRRGGLTGLRSGGNEGGRVMAGRFFAALKNDVRAIRMACVGARGEQGGLWKT